MRRKPANLREKLNELADHYDRGFLHSDPVLFPHRYKNRDDREIVAFLAAALAYGSVKQILGSVERVLRALEPIDVSPARAICSFSLERDRSRFAGFRHRFNNEDDMVCLMMFLKQMIEREGSIEGFFSRGSGESMRDRLASFTKRALELDTYNIYCKDGSLPDSAGVRFFFTNPSDGSACKRLCMFLRWVARPDDGVDLGLWKTVTSRDLVMPLDTHTTRICYWNGLSPSPFATWRNAEHVTNELRRFDANDPVRYDFAISRIGILRVRAGDAKVRILKSKKSKLIKNRVSTTL